MLGWYVIYYSHIIILLSIIDFFSDLSMWYMTMTITSMILYCHDVLRH